MISVKERLLGVDMRVTKVWDTQEMMIIQTGSVWEKINIIQRKISIRRIPIVLLNEWIRRFDQSLEKGNINQLKQDI